MHQGKKPFSRVFETKNGEKAAVIYPKAVHFKKDDAWEVIDNTLVLSKDQLAYENAQQNEGKNCENTEANRAAEECGAA